MVSFGIFFKMLRSHFRSSGSTRPCVLSGPSPDKFTMNVAVIGAVLLVLAVLPKLSFLSMVLTTIIISPGMLFVPGVLKGLFNFMLRRQCIPAFVETAHIECKWQNGLEITLSATDFQLANAVNYWI